MRKAEEENSPKNKTDWEVSERGFNLKLSQKIWTEEDSPDGSVGGLEQLILSPTGLGVAIGGHRAQKPRWLVCYTSPKIRLGSFLSYDSFVPIPRAAKKYLLR